MTVRAAIVDFNRGVYVLGLFGIVVIEVEEALVNFAKFKICQRKEKLNIVQVLLFPSVFLNFHDFVRFDAWHSQRAAKTVTVGFDF